MYSTVNKDLKAPTTLPTVGAALVGARRRRSLRLRGYDYAQAGAYFVTICTQGRACVFGEAADDTICLNAAGQLAATLWIGIPIQFPKIELDAFVVMPNHIHGIIVLPDSIVGPPLVGARQDARARAATRGAPTVDGRSATTPYKFAGVPMKSRLPSSTPQWRRMS